MYFFKEWNVLIVDDEPDVLTLSRLALEGFEVYGLPLVLHTAQTKAEAIDLLYQNPDLATNLVLAFVDIIMETDTAGLELCRHIRAEVGNRNTQIVIRTGQPGVAPETAVIDRYEINGYFTKMETTEEKLCSLVKGGVRQFLWSHMAQTYMAGLNEVLSSGQWRQKIEQLLSSFVESAPGVSAHTPLSITFDDTVLVQQALSGLQIGQWQQMFDQVAGLRLTLDGNQYVRRDENAWGIHIVARANAEVTLLCETAFAPPEDLIIMTHDFLQGLAILWKRTP